MLKGFLQVIRVLNLFNFNCYSHFFSLGRTIKELAFCIGHRLPPSASSIPALPAPPSTTNIANDNSQISVQTRIDARIQQLKAYTKKEIQHQLVTIGYKYCIFLSFFISIIGFLLLLLILAVKKDKLIKWLAKWEVRGVPAEKMRVELEQFISSTVSYEMDSYPPIQLHYRENFNGIDRWSHYRDAVTFRPYIKDVGMRLLVGCVELAYMETYMLYYDHLYTGEETDFNQHISQFGIELSFNLNQ